VRPIDQGREGLLIPAELEIRVSDQAMGRCDLGLESLRSPGKRERLPKAVS